MPILRSPFWALGCPTSESCRCYPSAANQRTSVRVSTSEGIGIGGQGAMDAYFYIHHYHQDLHYHCYYHVKWYLHTENHYTSNTETIEWKRCFFFGDDVQSCHVPNPWDHQASLVSWRAPRDQSRRWWRSVPSPTWKHRTWIETRLDPWEIIGIYQKNTYWKAFEI